jgi:mxaJ protein
MFLRCLSGILAVVLAGTALAQSPLRICADPDNLPFSNRMEQGFDIEIAKLVAQNLHRTPVFVWTRSRRGFVREQFNKNACDILIGVPVGMRGVTVSNPYYASSYVFVTPAKQHLQIASFTDPQLDQGRIGLQILEEDLSPPSIPLIRSGHAPQLIGFDGFGSHEGDVVRAVSSGKIGVAVVWGPVAGYYAQHSPSKLTLTRVTPLRDSSGLPFAYRIGFGVHKSDSTLLKQLDGAITELQPQIRRVLARYYVPVVRAEDVP